MPDRRALLTAAVALLACLQAACTTPVRPDHLAKPDKRSLGRVAVVPARFAPEYVFDALSSSKSEAAAKDALLGIGECARAVSGGGWVAGLLFLVCAPVAAVVGTISGVSRAAAAKDVEAAKASAERGIAALELQEATAEALLRHGKELGIQLGRLPADWGPATSEALPAYAQARDAADSVLEMSVLNARAFTPGARDLRISLGMQVRVRLINALDGNQLDSFAVRCGSPLRPVDEWLAAEEQAIRTAFDACAASIAEQALDEVLLVYHPRGVREQQAGSESERVPPYALRAIEPPIRTRFFTWPSRVTYGALERYLLESAQPTFRWERWPRGFDVAPGGGPGDASDVRYDLRIFGEKGIAYERRGLLETAHRPEQPLEPCQTYRWTVRARFTLADAPRATEWTGAFDTIGGPVAPWWIRRGSAPVLAGIPDSAIPFYPIVETPGAGGEACPGR